MPPPASPIFTASRSASLGKPALEDLTLNSLETQSKALHDRITLLTTNGVGESSHQLDPGCPSPVHSIDNHRIRELQARIETLEVENQQLSEKHKANADRQSGLIDNLEADCNKLSELNEKLTKDRDEASKAHEATLANLQNLQSLYDTSQKRIDEFENQFSVQLAESQRITAELNAELSSVGSARQKLEQENEVLQNEKTDLVAQVEDLSAQVDELRVAGQVSIFMMNQYSAKSFSRKQLRFTKKGSVLLTANGMTSKAVSLAWKRALRIRKQSSYQALQTRKLRQKSTTRLFGIKFIIYRKK
jgi:CAP-Gly domain-containing linker protein 1